jgi:hypothetical protein
MKYVIAWFRWVVDSAHPQGAWEFNHVEDGVVAQTSGRPTPKTPEQEKMWKGGKWSAVQCHLEDREFCDMTVPGLVFETDRPTNLHFTFDHSTRQDKKLGGVHRLTVKYKGESLAIFEGNIVENGNRAMDYIRTYGYLAEWTYRKHTTGQYVNWHESLRVHV